ncbi:MAG: hypothetical protein ABI721_04765 [Candidatus Dojkabacteria bacterium]
MPPRNANNSQLTQQLTALIPNFCDKCGAKHNKNDVEIINQDPNGISCRLDCHNCGNSYVMFLNSPSEGVLAGRKAVIKTDISNSEMRKYTNAEILDNNEILDALIALKEVKNIKDFNILFPED